MVAALLLILFAGPTCGSSSNQKPPANKNAARPRITVAPSAANGDIVARPPGGETAAAGFVPSSPTPAATCGPGDLLRQVSKDAALPADYVPPDLVMLQPIDASPNLTGSLMLRREAEQAIHRLLDQARANNLSIVVQSSYRGYQDQAKVYQSEVQNFGQAQADRESARPGHSEHQLGLAVDFSSKRLNYDLNDSFAATPEGKWLQQNATQAGIVQSYPEGQEPVTGYMYEPWHYRYIGVEAAQAFAKSGQTLTEWLSGRQLGCHA